MQVGVPVERALIMAALLAAWAWAAYEEELQSMPSTQPVVWTCLADAAVAAASPVMALTALPCTLAELLQRTAWRGTGSAVLTRLNALLTGVCAGAGSIHAGPRDIIIGQKQQIWTSHICA